MKMYKRIVFVAIMALSSVSCCLSGRDYAPYEGKEYMYYAENVLNKCMIPSVEILDYVIMAKEKFPKPMKEGTYVIPDNKGYKVGPFVCSVENADTVWYVNSERYIVRSPRLGEKAWTIIRDDSCVDMSHRDYKYIYTVTAIPAEKTDPVLSRHTWTIKVDGVRKEKSDYSMEFSSEGEITLEWDEPETFRSSGCRPTGLLGISFKKGNVEKDWLKVLYQDGSAQYQTSYRPY